MLGLASEMHPQEVVLLLRGKLNHGDFVIEEFLLPPFASAGRGFAQFPAYMLPIDFSIIGTAHSHPSGRWTPSIQDLHNFYGRIMMIFAYPYIEEMTAIYNGKGEQLSIIILD